MNRIAEVESIPVDHSTTRQSTSSAKRRAPHRLFATIKSKSLAQIHRQQANASHVVHVVIPQVLIVACWWAVIVFHVFDIAFLIATTWLYRWLLYETPSVHDILSFLNISISDQTMGILIGFFAVIAGLHCIVLVCTVSRSVHRRKQVFSTLGRSRVPNSTSAVAPRSTNRHLQQEHMHTGVFTRSLTLKYRFVMSHYIFPLFSIDGEYFDQCFLIQEFAEVICQVYQAYNSSVSVASRWINNLMVSMIFLNCVSTPFIHWFVPVSKKPLRRLLSVIISSFLNFVNSLVIPVIIFIPYIRAYDLSIAYFPANCMWNDVWWVKAIRENQQVLVTSYVDFITTLLPHLSLLNCLIITETILFRHVPITVISPKSVLVVPVLSSDSFSTPKSTLSQTHLHPHRSGYVCFQSARTAINFVVRCFLVLSGIAVLGIHIAAQSPKQLPGCRLLATPWFGTNHSCAVMNVNCYRRGIQGHAHQIDVILSQLNSETLFTLIFTHCPALEMPPSLRQQHRFQVLEIYNSTLVNWREDASIRQQDNEDLYFVTISRSNLSGIPSALLDNELPSSLYEIIMFETNLTEVPTAVEQAWRFVGSYWCTHCALTQLPAFLPATQWTFENNLVLSIDFDVFGARQARSRDELQLLDLSGCPLTQLPNETTASLDQLTFLGLEYTQLKQVPKYIRDWYHRNMAQGNWIDHSLYGSPYCAKLIGDQSGSTPIDQHEEVVYQQSVCAEDHFWASAPYPIDIVEPQRLP